MTNSSYAKPGQKNRSSRLIMIGIWVAVLACLFVFLIKSSSSTVLNPSPKSTKKLVTSMPGWPSDFSKDFKLYSGSLDIPTSQGKSLFYTFVTSQSDPSNDPVILWLNGGPGCSSLLGFLRELGPFLLDEETGEALKNDFSWNKNANVLFLEGPPGVGFSTANISNETYNDQTSMVDQYEGLQEFFKLFPEYVKNEFWMSGESYAGVYVPNLAYYIDLQNPLKNRTSLNLKGFMIGNAFTTMETFGISKLDFYLENNIITKEEYENATELSKACMQDVYKLGLATPACGKVFKFYSAKTKFNNINPHDVTKPCLASPNSSLACINTQALESYLNKREVQAALGVPEGTVWEVSSRQVEKRYRQEVTGSVARYPSLIEKKYKILIFSGDTDAVVPYLDSIMWIESLGLKVLKERRFWYLEGNKLGGNVTEYDGITFATIRGAGHMAPEDKKEENLWLINKFMAGEKI